MGGEAYRFGQFALNVEQRRLMKAGRPVECTARYFDALTLLVRHQGRLVTKDEFFDTVWNGVPVTDEALTQCIRTLRRALGDKAASPSFIETVPKHGYRFIANVQAPEPANDRNDPPPPAQWAHNVRIFWGGLLGATGAGAVGGVIYALLAVAPKVGGVGASAAGVVFALTLLTAMIGGGGVSIGIAAAEAMSNHARPWLAIGGALGGLIIGGLVNLVGSDAFSILFGQPVRAISGAGEGCVLGGATGLAAALVMSAGRWEGIRFAAAGLIGALAGFVIAFLGGRLMLGSLDALLASFPNASLRMAVSFGPRPNLQSLIAATFEGALFVTCICAGMRYAAGRASRR